MKCYKNLLIINAFFLIGFMVSTVAVSHLAAQDKAEKQAADELVVENSSGETLSDEESVTKKKKKDESFLIQVTAQKRKQNIQDVPGSLSALNVKQIEDAGISSTQEIHDYVPNMASFDFGRGFGYYSIRGQSNIVTYSNSVGIYVDGVPSIISGNTTDSALYDIERIEILRGAQGNLYGLNSAGGIVNIITKKPDNFWMAKAAGSYGNYNSCGYSASVSGPVVKDTLYMGFSGMHKTQDSYVEEEGADTHKQTFSSGRYQARWVPVKGLDIVFTAAFDNRDLDYNTWVLIDNDSYKNPNKGMAENDKTKTNRQSLNITYNTSWFEFSSITGRTYSENNSDGGMDFTSGGQNLMSMYYDEENSSWVQEIRLNSNDKKSSLKWLAGGFYLNHKEDIQFKRIMDTCFFDTTGVTPPTGIDAYNKEKSTTTAHTASLFFQTAYTVIERLTLTAGCRYDFDKKELDYNHDFNGTIMADHKNSVTYHAWSPKAVIDFRAHDSVMVYTSAAKGFKAGGYSPLSADDPDKANFDPEYAWTFEGGVKTNWWKNRIMANIAGFYTMIEDIQMFLYDSAGKNYYYSNAAKAQTTGVEVETMISPFSGLEVMASFGFLFSEFKEHEIKANEGNSVPLAPEYQAGLAVQYTSPLGLFVRGEGNWNGKTYFDEANNNKQDAYMILNGRLGYKSEHLNINFFINNLLNKEYYNFKVAWGGGMTCGMVGTPRTFGAEATLEF